MLRSAGRLVGGSKALPPITLSVRRLTDLNARERNQSITPCVMWHPNGKLALTAGPDQTLRLFRADGAENPKLQSVHVDRLPITSAAFTPDGAQVVMCGKGKHWCVFDLHSGSVHTLPGLQGRTDKGFNLIAPSPAGDVIAMIGESGAVHLVSAASKQLVATLQAGQGDARFATQAARFTPDGAFLHVAGEGASVRVWDVRRRCCVHTWHDRGGLRVTSLATSPDGELVAAGSDSGAVNLYRTAEALTAARPPPTKEFLNLTAAVTTLEFNPTSECLCFASKYVRRALRVAHVAQGSVFSNWPTGKTPLAYVQSTAFSPSSGHVAFGTDKGKVLLYAMNHYATA